jgi:hypothetical protein
MFDNFYMIVHWLGRLLHPHRAVHSPPEPPSVAASRDVERNAEWARRYLAWHARTVAGPSMPIIKPSNSR